MRQNLRRRRRRENIREPLNQRVVRIRQRVLHVLHYAIAVALMILKAVSMSWLTVVRMMQVKGGFSSPEDLRKTALNPESRPGQLAPNDRVDRIRRIQMNDLENLPFFLVAGFLFVLSNPSLLLARVLLYGYVASRLVHFAMYLSARTHEAHATWWTIGSLILVLMTCRMPRVALGFCSTPIRYG